ncbi:MAG: flagellar biosynthesis protein FlgA [Deltaproteobacteria bacterium RIFOXYD12_FULL_55_16]|nr:MAG: flagellar biosynthesis protein FlgA [Deltaproteobacteria bacterium RIFOXYD12_FULL_55_16]
MLFVGALLLGLFLNTGLAHAVRLKDLASVKGVRNNQLVGYGIVVGLNGTGDGNKAAFTGQGLSNMLNNLGVKVDPESTRVKNIASVMVTATLPPFFKAGQNLDVTISSVGDATSLQGGTLLATPLKGLDNNVYAMAQGPISIGGGAEPAAGARQKNHLTVARISNGASVEREVPVSFANKESITISLASPDFTTISLLKTAIDTYLGGNYATARDAASVEVEVPAKYRAQEIALLAALENIEINPERRAKVVLNERTGTVVMGDNVTINQFALSHGNLSLQVKPPPPPGVPVNSPADPVKVGQKVVTLQPGVSLGELVRALNSVGVAPRELIAIFQAIKAAGALQAELEII